MAISMHQVAAVVVMSTATKADAAVVKATITKVVVAATIAMNPLKKVAMATVAAAASTNPANRCY